MKMDNFLQEVKDGEFKVHLKWVDKQTYGLYAITTKGEITISLNLALFIADTFIHELIHHRNPEWSERKVEKNATIIINKMTVKEINKLSDNVLKYSE